ncbi:unnamed protein product, partial [Allacma fusca]
YDIIICYYHSVSAVKHHCDVIIKALLTFSLLHWVTMTSSSHVQPT